MIFPCQCPFSSGISQPCLIPRRETFPESPKMSSCCIVMPLSQMSGPHFEFCLLTRDAEKRRRGSSMNIIIDHRPGLDPPNPRKIQVFREKPRKKTQKPANPEITLFWQFSIFVGVPKILHSLSCTWAYCLYVSQKHTMVWNIQ